MSFLESSNQRPFSGPVQRPSRSNPAAENESHESDFENNEFKCLECKQQYASKRNLKRHFLKAHPEKDFLEPVKEYKFTCEDCSRKFNNARHLRSHQRSKHGLTPAFRKLHRCYMCSMEFEKEFLLTHYVNEHNIDMKEETLSFSTFEEVMRWKDSMEKDTKCKFIVYRGGKEYAGMKHYFYKCHRSGYYDSKSDGIRHLKTQGSKKINFLCPSSIKISEAADGRCEIKFLKTHIGHEMELKHIQLSSSERQSLAEKLAMKIPLDVILDTVRESISDAGLQRLHLVTKQDLYNIESSYQLTSTKHSNDATSVDMWVKEVEESASDSCILLYKPQGVVLDKEPTLKNDDFALIIMNQAQNEMLKKYGFDCVCVDGTHGLNDYGFKLITLMVIDDMREGFPCAFFITNREDEEALSVFFKYIKNEAGPVTPDIFMSDMANAFYNAWSTIMGTPKQHLYCTWHVDRAWRKNLNKIKGKEKQVQAYKLLRTLLEERDECAVVSMIETALKDLSADADTSAFAEYLKAHYVNKLEQWAFCYRLHCGLNTNMHLERMHKTIKYIYLNGKTVKRLDKALDALMRFLRDKIVERLITLDKGKISSKLKNLRNRHKISCDFETVINKCEEGWNVLSSGGKEIYLVKPSKKVCMSGCKLCCTYCDACIHKYICSCPDNAIKWNMCKHIHKVCMFLKNENCPTSDIDMSSSVDLKICENTESDFLLKHLTKPSTSTAESIENEKAKLKMEFNEIINSLNKNQIQFMKKNLSYLKAVLPTIDNEINATQFPSSSGSSTKNIEPQRKFYPSKKRKLNNTVNMMPSAEERISIAANLLLKKQATTEQLDHRDNSN